MMPIEVLIFIFFIALIGEFIDSSLGMGYGTLLSPFLIIIGFEPLYVIPAILISQIGGGLTASVFHHRFGNVNFSKKSSDKKIVLIISIFGIFAAIFAAFIAVSISKTALKSYIGLLSVLMGSLLISRIRFSFQWKKMVGLGVLGAFNKALTGGGFGPVITSGQIICGNGEKNSIGCTTLAEVPICIVSFVFLILFMLLKNQEINIGLMIPMVIGAIVAAPFGAYMTMKFKTENLRLAIGFFVLCSGVWVLIKTHL